MISAVVFFVAWMRVQAQSSYHYSDQKNAYYLKQPRYQRMLIKIQSGELEPGARFYCWQYNYNPGDRYMWPAHGAGPNIPADAIRGPAMAPMAWPENPYTMEALAERGFIGVYEPCQAVLDL